jgi:hypothetical protein
MERIKLVRDVVRLMTALVGLATVMVPYLLR